MDNNSLIWFIVGIFFLLAEILLPGFVIFFFGIGGLVTSLFTYLFNIDSLIVQIIIFITSSVLSLIFLRKTFSKLFRGNVSGDKVLKDEFIGKKALVIHEIVPDSLNGKVEFNGTNWEAKSDIFIEKGTVVEIIERKDLKLIVKPL
ncbi:MAG: NfeD family protein [Ignavibacteria bacterium]|nr:NfeD family protein [Ignavibacteriota bacterium]